MTPDALCIRCNEPIPDARRRGRNRERLMYCSTRCAAGSRRVTTRLDLPPATVGAVSELVASADLMRQGFAVFRAMSPACSCDLLILCDGIVQRVEVRTGQRLVNGNFSFPLRHTDAGRFDILAVVIENTDVYYYPDPQTHLCTYEYLSAPMAELLRQHLGAQRV